MNSQTSLNKFAYELIENRSVRSYDFCGSININKLNTLLLASAKALIKVYIFQMGFLKQLTQLGGHKSYVKCLRFLNKQDHFLSGSLDQSIIVWSKQLLASSKYIQKIKTHSSSVVALVLHPTIENVFISASSGLIQFFQHSNHKQWFSVGKITEINQLFGMTINQNGTIIVTCGEDNLINIFEYQKQQQRQNNNQTWLIKQKINVKQWGFRVCFLDNEIFVFQPVSQNYNGTTRMNIYTLNQQNQFIKDKTIPIKGGGQLCMENFPPIYNQSKFILLMKNGNYINLFKYTEGQFRLRFKQAISFGISDLFGTLSDDGEYLITWDKLSRQIQIRIYTDLKINKQENDSE
ncbi:unnamed protein product [Paramecium primaurelia]|uniref:Uncharacterized protein n=1 Tax=Paramecium primaurelia TaxID=5886 RepID=A0A8S1KAD9_PARPR|nr:unnamed protein product [Paramecium primaurelia]